MNIWRAVTSRTRKIMLCVGTGAIFAFAFATFYLATPSPQETWQVEKIDKGDIEKVVLVTGTLKPALQVNVGAQVNGQLRKLYVRQGERVKKGQLLAEIDPTLQESDLNNAQAQLASAKAQKLSSQATLTQYRLEFDRQRRMLRDGSAVRSDYEQAKAQYEAQLQQVDVNNAQIVQAEMAVKTASANLGYTRILAPIDGEVLGIVTREGQTIVSSQTAPTILVLAELDHMRVETRISEADIQKIHAGQPLWFYVIANPDKRYHGEMGSVQPAPKEALEEQSTSSSASTQQTSAVYYIGAFDVANTQRELKTSMTAQVFVRVAQAKNVSRIPIAALGHALNADHYKVSVLKDGKRHETTVRIGINDRQYAEVLEGLNAGDQVIVQQEMARG
ncbi:efflux RND transporter periplasmic adaptor subunit [Enterobacteriaceae bacterium G50]|nr:efflux RND transporter periplasmic adaptor subunit [Enterobacteriaceae bacterium G50]